MLKVQLQRYSEGLVGGSWQDRQNQKKWFQGKWNSYLQGKRHHSVKSLGWLVGWLVGLFVCL